MPATSSGRIVKTKKAKGGTAHQKNHRWESFTAKISKLNSLDPLRRVRRYDLDAEDLSATTSYFKNGLERWSDLNLSDGFIAFSHDVQPMCDSLPQILHFEDKIMDLLATHLERKERESVEPLLSLLTDFAHDLGIRFEKHYARALALVTALAGTPQDVDVIEWTFTCLAFLFKYLSKLLAPDLRPTYDAVAPLLGRERQQQHIARFAAEAMSFLIKKAGAPAHREKGLRLIVSHTKKDLESMVDTRQFVLYYHGQMTLFAEAIKGNGLTIHSSGTSIFECLLSVVDFTEDNSNAFTPWEDLICGVLTSLVHHTNAETLKDIIDVVITRAENAAEAFQSDASNRNLKSLMLSARCIGVVAGVRMGSRIQDWPNLLTAMAKIMKAVTLKAPVFKEEYDERNWRTFILSTSIVLQYCSMDALIPIISGLMDALTKDPLSSQFLKFCSLFAQVESERFRSLVLPYFQRFLVTHWSDGHNEDTLLILLPNMVASGVLGGAFNSREKFNLPQSWQDQMVSKFERLEASPFPEQAPPASYDKGPEVWHYRCLPKYYALLEVLECTAVHPSTNARIAEILLRKLKLALRPSSALADHEAHFIVGRGFSAYVRMAQAADIVDSSLEPILRAAAPRYSRLPNFLQAMLAYVSAQTPAEQPGLQVGQDAAGEDPLVLSLIDNLASHSHELRLLSLRLLEYLKVSTSGSTPEGLSTMIMIEQTPLDLQTARSSSMHIRKLASIYPRQESEFWLRKAIPSFCFGMLTVKFAQIWDDASAALKIISETKFGEDAVSKLVFKWLETPSAARDGSSRNIERERNAGLTDFECSNLLQLHNLAVDVDSNVRGAQRLMLERFKRAQELVSEKPLIARSQALRVLAAAPQIAEKKSRQLVPMFLSWAGRDDEPEQSDDAEQSISDWTRKDQKSQLDLFGLFNNPRVLFRADKVYVAILALVANGDLDIQRSALKALFTWKSPSIRPYQENLLNLLDEARFKDELAIMLQGQTLIQPEHRQELMPVLLRLLYGRTISRKGAASGKQGMEARRLTVLRNLTAQDIGGFLDIALNELKDLNLIDGGKVHNSIFEQELLSVRKQVGFMHMMEDVLKELGTKAFPFTRKLVEAILYCMIWASKQLKTQSDQDEENSDLVSQVSMLKVIRQTGFKCFILMFTNAVDFEWSSYIGLVTDELVSPRLEKLPIETAQGTSGLLQLISTWSASYKTVKFLCQDTRTLSKVAECLIPQASKDSVKLFALNIIQNVLKIAGDERPESQDVIPFVKDELLTPNMDTFLTHIGGVLRGQQDLSKDLLEACVTTVSELAPFVSGSTQAQNLVDVSIFLLDQPSRRVSPKTKGGLLLILQHFVPLYDLQDDPTLKHRVYSTVTSLFGFFKDRKSREVLSKVLLVYSRNDPILAHVAALCTELNSFSGTRLDEPDYDRRLKAFNEINKDRDVPFTAHQWTPLLYNALFYIKHDEEFGILSTNSSDAICRFVDTAGKAAGTSDETAFRTLLSEVLITALHNGVREPSEVIRREYLKVMAHLVRTFPTWSEVSDMTGLLKGDDELEASFFNNIIAAGKGRQSSALGQLAAASERGDLSSKNVSHFFIPLIEHFIFDRAEGNDAHNLAAETTTTVGILAASLEWPQYRAMLRRFIGYISGKPELEKQIIKLLGRVIDALALAAENPKPGDEVEVMDVDQPIDTPPHSTPRSTLARTMPKQGKLADDLTTNIIPPLQKYLHDKDESTVSLRVPVAVILVRLLKLLPQERLAERLPAVLTDICHILRSKAQESRDMTRDTLVKICVLLGPSCVGFVLKELRGALARGYQLHVLSYTMHSILVATVPEYAPGDLDYCLPSIVAIIMDDIFGATGQEKDAEEYVSKMREVKSSKSHDSMELIAKTATLSRLTDLVRPIQVLLKEKLNIRMVRKIDELLNRISTGLLKNASVQSRDSLIFCYEVIQDVYNIAKPQAKVKDDYRLKKYLVQKGAKKSGNRGATTVHTYKLVRFAFDVLRAVVKKYDHLRTSANLSGFVPIIGDALAQGEEEVKVASFKLLTAIVKVPFKVAEESTTLFRVGAAEATKSIAASSTTTSDISQAALKLISVILRDRHDVQIKDTSVDQLLDRLREDMTDPERRHVTFNFLRAVLDAKIETAVVYDILDYTGTIMVTNNDKDTRDLARGAYFQFLREYPQKKNRWSKQLNFIVANLQYEREGGRLSILEVIHLLLSKSSSDFVQEVAATCFVPLIMVLVNDEEEKCRMAAGEVIKEIFRKADKERINTFLDLLRSWAEQTDKPSVMRLALQSYGFYYEVQGSNDSSDVSMLQDSIVQALETAAIDSVESDWELIYSALQLGFVMCSNFPAVMFATKAANLWKTAASCLSYPHAWVKHSSARLFGIYFADFGRNNIESGLEGLPLFGSKGLELREEDISELVWRTVSIFKTPGLSELLANEAVKNLFFLGRCAAINNVKYRSGKTEEGGDSENEDDVEEPEQKTALQFLFARLSFILRRETSPPRAPGLIPKTSALQLIHLLCSKLPAETLSGSLQTILLPLHNLTDPSIPIPYSTDDLFKTNYEAIKASATEIMSVLQKTCGTAEYTKELLKVREAVKARRNQRTMKRRIDAVSAPEKFGKDKRKKVERKKERRKERGLEHRDQRRGY